MLGKLFRYEMKATARIFLPFYGVLLVLTLVNKLFGRVFSSPSNASPLWAEIVAGLTMMVYVFLICTIFALTVIIAIQRFYKNLLGDEGYLMFTLPVNPWQHITSKMAVASIWTIASIIVTMISIFLLALNKEMLQYMPNFINELVESFKIMGGHAWGYVIEVILLAVFGTLMGELMIYLSIAIGQLFSKHKLFAAFGAFVGVSFLTNIVTVLLGELFGKVFPEGLQITEMYTALHVGLWMIIVWVVAFGAIYFVCTNYILKHKLNLE